MPDRETLMVRGILPEDAETVYPTGGGPFSRWAYGSVSSSRGPLMVWRCHCLAPWSSSARRTRLDSHSGAVSMCTMASEESSMRVSTSTEHLTRSMLPAAGGGTSQIRAVPSVEPLSTARSVGTECHADDAAFVFEHRTDRLAGGKVPDPGRSVSAAHQHGAAVGGNRQVHDQALE